jgi:hypothetical protein
MGKNFGNQFVFDLDTKADGQDFAVFHEDFLGRVEGKGFDIASLKLGKRQNYLFHRITWGVDDAENILEIMLKINGFGRSEGFCQNCQFPDPVQTEYFEFLTFIQGQYIPTPLKLNIDTITIINDVRPKSMAVSYKFFPFNPPKSAYVYYGNCRIPKLEPNQEIQFSEPILKRLGSLRGRIIVFAALGKVTGTVLYKTIARQLQTNPSDKYFLGTLPFEFEGSWLRHESKKAVAHVDAFHHQKVLDLEVLREQYRNLPVTITFNKVDEWLLEEFMEIKFQSLFKTFF